MGFIPAIAAGVGLLGNIFGARSDQRDARNQAAALENQGRNQFNLGVYQTQAQLDPNNSRQRALDPTRNAVLADLIGRNLPGVNPSVLSALQSAGPRNALPTAPAFSTARYETPGFLDSFFSQGFPFATDIAAEVLRGRQPGANTIQGQRGVLSSRGSAGPANAEDDKKKSGG